MRETITARDKALATRNQTISHLTQHLTEVKNTASAAYQELEQRYLDLQARYDSALEEVDEQKYECDLVRQELANEREWTRQLKAAFEEQYDENQYNRQLANELLDRELQRHRDNQEFLHSIENMTQAEYEAYVDALAGYQPTAPSQQNGYASDEDDPYDYPEEDYDY